MRTRVSVATTITFAALLTAPLFAEAQERSAGGVTIYDERNCPGNANSPQVTIPFSFGVTGLVPLSSAQVFVTDKDSQPEVTYGPATIRADATGNVCLNINVAPAGSWKVDVVEQGSGFTDSKVFTIEGLELPPVPTVAPTAPPPPPPPPPPIPLPTVDPNAPVTTVDPNAPVTTLDPNATTTVLETTTTVEPTPSTTEPTTIVPVPPEPAPTPNRPWSLLPWILERVTGELITGPSPSAALPATGTSSNASLIAIAFVGLGGALVLAARRTGQQNARRRNSANDLPGA